MTFVVLTEQEVIELLPLDDAIEVVEQALSSSARGSISFPLRSIVRPPDTETMLGLMPAHRSTPEPAFGVKVTCIVPSNPERGLDSHQGVVLLFDGSSGQLLAVVHGAIVTALRTAAASAVATRALALPDAHSLLIIGSGFQARWHLRAIARVRPLRRVRIWSRTAENAAKLIEEAKAEGVDFDLGLATNLEDAVGEADIIVTATSSSEPILCGEWLRPGTHINAIGSSVPANRELDADTVASCVMFVDSRESARAESGDILLAAREVELPEGLIRAELGEVLTGAADGRLSGDEVTVYNSLGVAAEDLATAEFLFARAKGQGRGVSVPF